MCDALLPHSRTRPIFASSQEITVRGRCTSPCTSGQSRLGPTEFGEDASERTTSVPSTPTPFRCTTTRTSIVPLEGCLQRLAYWIVDTVALAYQSQGEPCPQGVRAHYTRSVASSHALAHGASLADHCRAAGWATLNTFARFYSLCVEPVSSCVLGGNNWPVSRLLRHSPSPGDTSTFFLLQFSSPDGEPW